MRCTLVFTSMYLSVLGETLYIDDLGDNAVGHNNVEDGVGDREQLQHLTRDSGTRKELIGNLLARPCL